MPPVIDADDVWMVEVCGSLGFTTEALNKVRIVCELGEQHLERDLATEQPAIPRNIVTKRPSAELAPDQFDEDNLLPYAVLDPIVQGYVEEFISDFDTFRGWVQSVGETISIDVGELNEWLLSVTAQTDYERIITLIGRMEFKRRQTCPGPKLSKVAFGIGRRVPIVKAYI